MTNERKIIVLQNAVNLIASGGVTGMCNAIRLSYTVEHIDPYVAFPELLNYKPEGLSNCVYWFPEEDTVTRIRILNELIQKYENNT